MGLVRSALYRLYASTFGRMKVTSELQRLNRSKVPGAKELVVAIDKTANLRRSAEEGALIVPIEKRRAALEASPESVTLIDFGAGSGEMRLSQEEMAKGREIKRHLGKLAKTASKPYRWALLLFHLMRQFKPQQAIEMGTAVGISAAYQGSALKLNGSGRLHTLDGAETLAAIARQTLSGLELDDVQVVVGRFQDTLDGVLKKHGPIDYIFIDGHHDEEATKDYYRQVQPHLQDGALLIFDDIYWSPGMARAWTAIYRDDHVSLAADLHNVGICLYSKEGNKKTEHYRIPL